MLHEDWNIDPVGTSSLTLNEVAVSSGYIPSPPQLSPAVGKDPYMESVLSENEFMASIHDEFYGDRMGMNTQDQFDMHPYNDETTDLSQRTHLESDLIENGDQNIDYMTLEDVGGAHVYVDTIADMNGPTSFAHVDEQLINSEYGDNLVSAQGDASEFDLREKIYNDLQSSDYMHDNNQPDTLLVQNKYVYDPYGNVYPSIAEQVNTYQLQEKQVAVNNGLVV